LKTKTKITDKTTNEIKSILQEYFTGDKINNVILRNTFKNEISKPVCHFYLKYFGYKTYTLDEMSKIIVEMEVDNDEYLKILFGGLNNH
jgi:hypothetical protein